ncbi:MAG: hypothetical protein AAFY02_18090 [Pseudomonadota bacterium]
MALLASLVLIAACTQQPLPGVDPTPPRSAPPPPTAAQQTLPPPVFEGDSAVPSRVVEEDTSGWTSGNATSAEQHQADLQSCYSFANGQVRHDQRINDDRSTLFGGGSSATSGNLFAYERNIRPYDNEQRFGELFRSCMASRGYQQN